MPPTATTATTPADSEPSADADETRKDNRTRARTEPRTNAPSADAHATARHAKRECQLPTTTSTRAAMPPAAAKTICKIYTAWHHTHVGRGGVRQSEGHLCPSLLPLTLANTPPHRVYNSVETGS